MNPNDHQTKFNFNSNQPTGNGIFGSNASNTANGRPVTTLSVPVLSPTHFDDPVVPPQQPYGAPAPAPAQIMTPEEAAAKEIKKFKVLSIVLAIFSASFLIFSIWGLISSITTSNQLTQARSTISSQSAIIAAVEATTGVKITTPTDVPTFKTTHGYIYLDGWNIKLKVPEDLTSVSYIFDQKYRPSICFNALKKGVQYFPAFADIAQNTGGMGCLVRVDTSEGNADEEGRSFGTLVFTDNKGYNYFYVAPEQVFSTDAAEQGLEQTSVQIIKTMLSGNNISLYE